MAAAVWEHNHMHGCNIQNTTVWIPTLFPGSKNCTWNWPCGWHYIIPQYETEEFIQEGLQKLKEWNPGWSPQFFMTDKSAQELGTDLVCGFAVYYEQ